MPWTLDDYPPSMKNFNKTMKKKAIDIANALVEEDYEEDRAIPIAIEQAKRWYEDATEKERKTYLKEGKVTKHDHQYASNPELLNENEMVIKHDEGWAVQSKNAKKAAKIFDIKNDAIAYGRKVAKNKQTKLEIYKEDDSLETISDHSK